METLSITPLTPAIGALINGIDTADVTMLEAHALQLRQALLDHQVIFFREQHLDPAAQVRLASVFGSVNDVSSTFAHHPENAQVELLESQGRGPGTDVWHAGLTWQRTPPLGACLYAVDVPAAGGDTMWASMTAAYDSLAPKMQDYVSELTAIHSWEGPEVIGNVLARADGEARYRWMRETYPPLEVPVVAIHPETKKRVLTVNALYTTSICGVTREERSSRCSPAAHACRNGKYDSTGHRAPWRSGTTARCNTTPSTTTTRHIA